jgi:outer membrane protein
MDIKSSARGARALFAVVLLAAATAQAAEHEGADRGADEPDGYNWGLGAGVGIKKSPYAGVNSKTSALPLISFENKYVRLFGNQFDVKLPSYGPFDFSLRTQVAIGDGYKGSDSARLNGMADRKGAVFVGGAATWRNAIANVSVDWLKDVSGRSKGSEFKLGAEHPFRFAGAFEIAPHAQFLHVDGKYVDYYYGVRASEATPVRQEYLGKSTSELQAGVRFAYLLAAHQRILLDVSDTHLGSGITDSPIVDRTWMPALRIGYTYAF